MPLLDHYHPPLSRTHPWHTFHGAWAAAMARLLNTGVLPAGYYALPFTMDDTDERDVRVEVRTEEGEPRLAATVELVSPRSDDRARESFVAKCVDSLRRGWSLAVIDAVTKPHIDMIPALVAMLEKNANKVPASGIAAVAYRVLAREDGELQGWLFSLEVGGTLPILPLWLGSEITVPLDLEASHAAACVDLRIRQAG